MHPSPIFFCIVLFLVVGGFWSPNIFIFDAQFNAGDLARRACGGGVCRCVKASFFRLLRTEPTDVHTKDYNIGATYTLRFFLGVPFIDILYYTPEPYSNYIRPLY